jgi:hypothetical protein
MLLPLALKLSTDMKHSLLLFSGKNHSSALAQEIAQLYKSVQATQSDFFEPIVISMSNNYFDIPICLDSTGKMHQDYGECLFNCIILINYVIPA